MKLHRVRAGASDLPRRLIHSTRNRHATPLPNTSSSNIIESEENTSKSRRELKESKKLLFNKYIGDHRKQMISNSMRSSSSTSRPKFVEMSDDAIPSSYPNSSYSTVRDVTGSSISSAIVGGGSHTIDELQDSPVKERDLLYPPTIDDYVMTSDSFEYDNHDDRHRIFQMASRWVEAGERATLRAPQYPTIRALSQQREVDLQNLNRYPFNLNTSDHPAYYRQPSQPDNIIDTSSRPPGFRPHPHKSLYSLHEQISSSSNSSTLLSNRSGYTREHLLRAKKFGAVVGALRKPGHHVGPAKNPDCMCEHCKRFVAEREQMRGRALSMGDEPLMKSKFWLQRNLV